eukprot:360963-Chlamydomonas_euryale.AAC.5
MEGRGIASSPLAGQPGSLPSVSGVAHHVVRMCNTPSPNHDALLPRPTPPPVHHPRSFSCYFGVSEAYVLLAHLRWMLRRDVATLTPHCLDTVCAWLTRLLRQERGDAGPALAAEEVVMLLDVKASCQQLLLTAFEQYANLSEQPADSATPAEQYTGVLGPPSLGPAPHHAAKPEPLRLRAITVR